MTVHRTVRAKATAFIRFCTFVAITDDRCAPDPQRTGAGGIAKRPSSAGAREGHAPGEDVTVLVDGGVLAELPEGQRWVELCDGRLVDET